jgi:hypothetical protein
MNTLVARSTAKAASPAELAERIAYISDPTNSSHKGKVIHPARNYNCSNNSSEAFRNAVDQVEEDYQLARQGKRGKRSHRLFEEVIYSSPHGANLTPPERESVESMLINLTGRLTACRTAWHVDESTGRADLHVLLASKTQDYPPRVTLWADFGGSEGSHIYAEFDKLDDLIIRQLNRAVERKTKLKSASKIRKEKADKVIGKKSSLAAEIAAKVKGLVTRDNIAETIDNLGHVVSKVTDRSISVVFNCRTKPRRYNIDELLASIDAEQHPALGKPSEPSQDGPEIV